MKRIALLFWLLLAASAHAAAPTFVAAGAESTTSVALPAGITAGDVLIILAQSSNQAITAPAGWTEIDSQARMAGGTAAAAGANRLAVFWKRAGASESAVAITNPGNHIECAMLAFRGCETSGNPWSDVGVAFFAASNAYMAWMTAATQWLNGGSVSSGAFNTTINDSLVVLIVAHSRDVANDNIIWGAGTFLTSRATLTDQITNTGTGGGFSANAGLMATAGNIFAGTYQIGLSGGTALTNWAMMILALVPPAPATPTPTPPVTAPGTGTFLPF
jgi:hypothetical protein